jgi:hypothetical protein
MLEHSEESEKKVEEVSETISNEVENSKTTESKTVETIENSEVVEEDAIDQLVKETSEVGVDQVEVQETDDAVNEVEEAVAKTAEEESGKKEIPVLDYDSMDLEMLTIEFEKLIDNNPIQQIKSQAEGIKSAFNSKFGALLAEKKAAFLEEGGNSIDFQYSSPVKATYNKLLSQYREKRDAYYSELDSKLKANLEKRVEVIEGLKSLIENADTATMYKSFRELERTWRSIGPVPKQKYNDTWKIYHHHVERFYDLLHLSNDFRDLDFKHNLEEKIKIIQKVEALSEESDINFAFKELQDLHKVWKEDVGPVSKEMREEIWHKFSQATKKIHDKRHEYYRSLRSRYQEIIDLKLKVIEEIGVYDTSNNKTHNDWQKSIKDIEDLRQKYFNAGKLPYSKSEEVWQKFKTATKKFNHEKNLFYKQEKGGQQDNLNKKLALIEIAESVKDSDDWDVATNIVKKVQADWKKIGHVPRKFSDDIWKRFKAACNHYFDRLHQNRNEANKEQLAVVDTKKEFLESFKTTENASVESVKEAINNWRSLGSLPRNFRHLDGKFNKQVDAMLEGLSIDKKEITMLKFSNVVDGYLADNDVRKLESEQFFIRKKIDETVKEMQQLENNLSFFSNAKEDNPLVKNVRDRVEGFKEELEVWKMKLNYLKKLEY